MPLRSPAPDDPDWRRRWHAILPKIHCTPSAQECAALLASLGSPRHPLILGFVNAHAMNLCSRSAVFALALHRADILLRDGSGMAILYRLLGQEPGLNLNGTDLIPRLVRLFSGKHIALYGTREPYLERAAAVIAQQLAPGSRITTADGFRDAAAYVALAAAGKPDLIVLGMGMPKQEELAVALRSTLAHPCLIICGGAIIDFLGGKTSRAPAWMRRAGVEWLYRLALEPRRLFQRYVLGNPAFLRRAIAYGRFRTAQAS